MMTEPATEPRTSYVPITCRGCDTTGYVPDPYHGHPWTSLDEVRAAIVAFGWWIEDGRFWCPTCKAGPAARVRTSR